MNIDKFKHEQFGQITVLINDNNEFYFIAKEVASILEYASPDKMYKRLFDEDKIKINPHSLESLGNTGLRHYGVSQIESNINIKSIVLITEPGLFDAVLGSKKSEAKAFRYWITHDVLPSLSRNRCYILEDATQEQIDFESKYGKNRIYNTFFNSNDPNTDYEEFKILAKEKRDRNHHAFNNQDRIGLSKKIIEALENKARYAIASKEPIYKIMSYQELANKIQQDITSLTNQRQGGLRAQQTRKINKLRVQNEELTFKLQDAQKELEYYALQPQSNVEFLEIPYYGFSNNKMYEPDRNRFKRTRAYNAWCNNFPKYLLRNKSFTEHVDFTKEVCIEMFFKTNGLFDVDNFSKPLLDVIANALNINDKVFTKTICCECNEKVKDHYKDGRIYIRMYNYDPAKLEK